MAKTKSAEGKGLHPASGKTPEMVNSPLDSVTIFVEGTAGIVASPNIVKVHFVEHYLMGDDLKGRHVVSLAMPTDQFIKVANSMKGVADQIAAQIDNQANEAGVE